MACRESTGSLREVAAMMIQRFLETLRIYLCVLRLGFFRHPKKYGLMVSIFFKFLPGEMIQFDEHIFQMGWKWWNHKLYRIYLYRTLPKKGGIGSVIRKNKWKLCMYQEVSILPKARWWFLKSGMMWKMCKGCWFHGVNWRFVAQMFEIELVNVIGEIEIS